jgi:hypothetical protein
MFLLPLLLALWAPPSLARDPLGDTMGTFLSALYANDPAEFLPRRFTPNMTYTENNIVVPIGSTRLWKLAAARGPTENNPFGGYNGHVDFATNQIVAVGTLLEEGVPVIYIVRLRVNDDVDVTEIESMVVRDDIEGARGYRAVADISGTGRMGPEWEDDVSGGVWRLKRGRLEELTEAYYSGVGALDVAAFDKGCYRVDNGRVSTLCGTVSSLEEASRASGRGRRYVIAGVDVARQSVFSFATVDLDGRSWLVAESLRFNGREKIDRVETTWTEVPYGSSAPFDPAPLLWSEDE